MFFDQGESSCVTDCPQWIAYLDYMREGDAPVVGRLDRIAGSETMAIRPDSPTHGLRAASVADYRP